MARAWEARKLTRNSVNHPTCLHYAPGVSLTKYQHRLDVCVLPRLILEYEHKVSDYWFPYTNVLNLEYVEKLGKVIIDHKVMRQTS